MKPFNVAKRYGAKVASAYREVGIVVGVALVPVLAFAQGEDPFEAAVTSVTAKINDYWPQLVGIAAIAVGFSIGLKYIRKIRGAA
jgi:hypothetical protein